MEAVFQFTRPRGARPEVAVRGDPRHRVSIHAPAWGATPEIERRALAAWFQFTRPRGARPSARASSPPCSRFNSRARVGRD